MVTASDVIVIQHIRAVWGKAQRAGEAKRVRLDAAYRLPEGDESAPVVIHKVHNLAWDGPVDTTSAVERRETTDPRGDYDNIRWRLADGHLELTLEEGEKYFRQTPWPEGLPKPLLKLALGSIVRIEWNARGRRTMFGSNRAPYFTEHCFLVGHLTHAPADVFLTTPPRNHVDYRRDIY